MSKAMGYTTIPNDLDDSDLDVYQFRILIRIKRRGICYESQRSIADSLGISLAQVNRTIKWLKCNGWIEPAIDKKSGKVGYCAVIPQEQVQQESVIPQEHVIPEVEHVIPGERHLKKNNKENIYMQADVVSDFQNALAAVAKEKLAPGFNEEKYENAAFALIGWDAELSQVAGFADYWKQKGWHQNVPSLTNIVNHWQDYLGDRDLLNGQSTNGRATHTGMANEDGSFY